MKFKESLFHEWFVSVFSFLLKQWHRCTRKLTPCLNPRFFFSILAFRLLSVWLLVSCVSSSIWGESYDTRTVSILTASLFNQREKSRFSSISWRGNWVFRRLRLDLIDHELEGLKPDILLFQQALNREGSLYESDESILKAGALRDYHWKNVLIRRYKDTQEHESLVFATSRNLTKKVGTKQTVRRWPLGKKSYAASWSGTIQGQKVLLVNVEILDQTSKQKQVYESLSNIIARLLIQTKTCENRLVLGGYFPMGENSVHLDKIIQRFSFEDVASGYCQIASRCYTSSPLNELFVSTAKSDRAERADRIFVHRASMIYSSKLVFLRKKNQGNYIKRFGLASLGASNRFAWYSQVRLSRCRSKDIK